MIEATRDPLSTGGAANVASSRTFDGAALRWTPGPDEQRLPCEGERVPHTSRQSVVIRESVSCLRLHWRELPDVFVGNDQFIYWHWEKPPVAPDVFVAFGVASRHHDSYVAWEEGKPPDFVLEVLPPSSRRRGREDQLAIYAEMGAPEYFWYEPEGRVVPALAGFALRDGQYAPLPEETVAEGVAGIRSKVLGMCLCIKPGPHLFDPPLRFYDLAAGEFLPTHHELVEEHARLEEEHRHLTDDNGRLADAKRRLVDDVRRLAERRRRLTARIAASNARAAELEALIENEKMQRG